MSPAEYKKYLRTKSRHDINRRMLDRWNDRNGQGIIQLLTRWRYLSTHKGRTEAISAIHEGRKEGGYFTLPRRNEGRRPESVHSRMMEGSHFARLRKKKGSRTNPSTPEGRKKVKPIHPLPKAGRKPSHLSTKEGRKPFRPPTKEGWKPESIHSRKKDAILPVYERMKEVEPIHPLPKAGRKPSHLPTKEGRKEAISPVYNERKEVELIHPLPKEGRRSNQSIHSRRQEGSHLTHPRRKEGRKEAISPPTKEGKKPESIHSRKEDAILPVYILLLIPLPPQGAAVTTARVIAAGPGLRAVPATSTTGRCQLCVPGLLDSPGNSSPGTLHRMENNRQFLGPPGVTTLIRSVQVAFARNP